MNIENDPAETNRKIVQILARSLKPKPVQEIADEIQKSYNETLKHLDMIG
jgi:capsular polysaccharide biosynthesis protein